MRNFIPLPRFLIKKHACINIQNSDNQCFKWAVLSGLVHLKRYKIEHSNRVSTFTTFEKEFNLNFDGLEFPIQLTDISKFEK